MSIVQTMIMYSSGGGSGTIAVTGIRYTNVSSTTSSSIMLPEDIVAGELLLLSFVCAAGRTVTAPSGWVDEGQRTNGGGTTDRSLAVFSKIATGSDGTTANVSMSVASSSVGAIMRIENGSTVTLSTGVGGASVSPDPDSLTTGAGSVETLFIAAAACRDTAAMSSGPAGHDNFSTSVINNIMLGLATFLDTNDTHNPGAFTKVGTDVWVAATIGIN